MLKQRRSRVAVKAGEDSDESGRSTPEHLKNIKINLDSDNDEHINKPQREVLADMLS